MTHREQILVYLYQKTDDGFGEYEPALPVLQTDAPTWASIRQDSGDDLVLNERFTTANRYTIDVNYRNDFTWSRSMFVIRESGELIDIDGIREVIRRRTLQLGGVYVLGVDDTGQGTPSPVGGLTTLYYTVPSDASTLTLSAINGKTIYLIFRDGIEKKKVSISPQINEVMVSGSTLSLVTDDIFYSGERITILYK